MKKYKKTIGLLLAAILLVGGTFLATMSYLTSTDEVKNTFTIGKVEIDLDETKVDEFGVPIPGEARVKENEYKLLPGHEYTKDPIVTVKANSEDSYVRMLVTINNDAAYNKVFAGMEMDKIFLGHDPAEWLYQGSVKTDTDVRQYEFWYKEMVVGPAADLDLPALFTSIEIPGVVDNAGLNSLEGLTIDIVGQAIQADGFANAAAAWAAFDAAP